MIAADAYALSHRRFRVGSHFLCVALLTKAASEAHTPALQHAADFAQKAIAIGKHKLSLELKAIAALTTKYNLATLTAPHDVSSWELWSKALGEALSAGLAAGSPEALGAQAGLLLGEMVVALEMGHQIIFMRSSGELAFLLEEAQSAEQALRQRIKESEQLLQSFPFPIEVKSAISAALGEARAVPDISRRPEENDFGRWLRVATKALGAIAKVANAWPEKPLETPLSLVDAEVWGAPLPAALLLRSGDDEARLAWAEQSGGARGAFVRYEVLYRQWVRGGLRGRSPAAPPGVDLNQMQRLTKASAARITGPDGKALLEEPALSGGLVESASMEAALFLAHAPTVFAQAPLRHLRLRKAEGVGEQILSSPHLTRLCALDLSDQKVGDAAILALARNPAAQGLRWLELGWTGIGDNAVEALFASGYLRRLGYVGLNGNRLNDPREQCIETSETTWTYEETEAGRRLEAIHGRREWLHQQPSLGQARPAWDQLPELAPPKAIRVGFFRELTHGYQDQPSLQESARRARALPDEAAIVAWLRGCPTLIASPGIVQDALEPLLSIGPLSLHTDGVYVWPSDLAYYLERYHVSLPEAFLRHGRVLGWSAPVGLELDSVDF